MTRCTARLVCSVALAALVLNARAEAGDLAEFRRETERIAAALPSGFGDHSAATTHYLCYLGTMRVFESRPWFASWYLASTSFRTGFDALLAQPPTRGTEEYVCRRQPPPALLQRVGLLSLEGEPAGAAVTLNGAFVGRLPLAGLVLPAGEYAAAARAPGVEGSLQVAVAAGQETKATVRTAPATSPPPPHSPAPPGGEMLWSQDVEPRLAEAIWQFPQGVLLLVVGDRPVLRLYDGATGFLIRQTPLLQTPAQRPVPAGDRLVWTTLAGALYAYDPANGEAAYVATFDDNPGPPPACAGGDCCVARRTASGGTLHGFDLDGRRANWSAPLEVEPLRLLVAGTTALVLGRGARGGVLVAVDLASGERRWTLPVGDPERAVLAARDDIVLFHGGVDGEPGLLADPRTGTGPRLLFDGGARPTAVALDARAAYCATDDGRLLAFDRSQRHLLWEVELPGAGRNRVARLDALGSVVAVVIGGARASGGADGGLHVLDVASGAPLYSKDVLLSDAPVVLEDGRFLVPDRKATPFVRDLERGCTAWRLQTLRSGGAFEPAEVATDGRVGYALASRSGRLAAYRFGGCAAPIALPALKAIEPKPAGGDAPGRPVVASATSGSPARRPAVGDVPQAGWVEKVCSGIKVPAKPILNVRVDWKECNWDKAPIVLTWSGEKPDKTLFYRVYRCSSAATSGYEDCIPLQDPDAKFFPAAEPDETQESTRLVVAAGVRPNAEDLWFQVEAVRHDECPDPAFWKTSISDPVVEDCP